mmetsp:Transcript_24575/g.53646  ORF Transcript_24575/g.53646 Transcript_24575/m.53646 type:complete len:219 (-) Transcript_24575:1495-2151(-)
MHVQAEVLARLVLHHEGVVVVNARALLREEQLGDRTDDVALQQVDHALEPNRIEHDAVVVHRVGTHYGHAARLVVLQLVEEPVAEGHRKHVKREHSGRDLGADAPERRVASRRRLCRIRVRVRCVQRVPEPLCEPVALRTRGEVKKLRVEAHAAVLNLRLHLVRVSSREHLPHADCVVVVRIERASERLDEELEHLPQGKIERHVLISVDLARLGRDG